MNLNVNKLKKLRFKFYKYPFFYIILLIIAVLAYIFITFGPTALFDGSLTKTDKVPNGNIEVHFIDVGQGDAALIMTESGSVLVDAGTTDSGNKVATYVKNRTDSIDFMILSHPHEDHIGGASYVFDTVTVKNVIMPDKTADTTSFDRLLDSIKKSDARVISAEKGQGFQLGDLRIEILSPHGNLDEVDANNTSVIAKVIYSDTSFLFTGDAEKVVEKELLESGQNLKCNVIKVPHHGSSTSSTEAFIKAVSPDIAVISCEKGNSYGHPHYETTSLLDKLKIKTYRTDYEGTIVLRSDGKKVTLQ